MKMKPQWKTKWIHALRSDKYEQGQGQLRSKDNKFCCLGVLCDIVDPEGWEVMHGYPVYTHSEGRTATFPASLNQLVMDEGHFNDVKINYHGSNYGFTYLNDKLGLSFPEIADLVEQQL